MKDQLTPEHRAMFSAFNEARARIAAERRAHTFEEALISAREREIIANYGDDVIGVEADGTLRRKPRIVEEAKPAAE